MSGFNQRLFVSIAVLAAAAAGVDPSRSYSQEQQTSQQMTDLAVPVPTQEQITRLDAFAAEIRGAKHYLKAELAYNKIRDLGNTALPTVIELVNDESVSKEVRPILIKKLLQFNHPLVFPEALKYVESDNFQLKFLALNAIKKFGGKTSIQIALKNLDDPEEMIRVACANILVDSASPETMPYYDRLKDSKDARVRVASLMFLNRVNPDDFETQYVKAMLDPESSVRNAAAKYLDDLRGKPELPELLPYFSHADPGNRAYALIRVQARIAKKLKSPLDPSMLALLGKSIPKDLAERSSGIPDELVSVLTKLLSDPLPVVRFEALKTVQSTLENEYSFFFDRKLLETIVNLSKDESPLVRRQAFELIYNESIKIGIFIPMSNPSRNPLQLVSLLHWDSDAVTIPAYIDALDDPDPEIARRAFQFLKFSTGKHFGLPHFFDRNTPEISQDIIRRWSDWWDIEKKRTPQEKTVAAAEQLISSFSAIRTDQAKIRDTILALRTVTGRNFGWTPSLSNLDKVKVYNQWEAWWKENKQKHRAQWIVDSINDYGLDKIDGKTFHILSRIANRSFGMEILVPAIQQGAGPQLKERVNSWWKDYRKQHGIAG